MIYYVCGLLTGFLITMAVAVILWHNSNHAANAKRFNTIETAIGKLISIIVKEKN